MIEIAVIYTVLFVIACLVASMLFGTYLKKSWKYGLFVMLGCFVYFLISGAVVYFADSLFGYPINFFVWEMDIFAVVIYLIGVLAFNKDRTDLLVFLGICLLIIFLFPLNIIISSIFGIVCAVIAVGFHFFSLRFLNEK